MAQRASGPSSRFGLGRWRRTDQQDLLVACLRGQKDRMGLHYAINSVRVYVCVSALYHARHGLARLACREAAGLQSGVILLAAQESSRSLYCRQVDGQGGTAEVPCPQCRIK